MCAPSSRNNESGMALVVAMLVLLVLTLLGVVMMASVVSNRGVAGQSVTMRKALDTADAGVGEAISHLQQRRRHDRGESAFHRAGLPGQRGQPSGVGPDTTAIPTGQPAGAWLPIRPRTNRATCSRSPTRPMRPAR